MARTDVRLGISIGDPAGIGPEVMIGAANQIDDPTVIPIIIGRSSVVDRFYGDRSAGYERLKGEDVSDQDFHPGLKYLIDIAGSWEDVIPGAGSVNTGLESRAYIDLAIDLWKRGLVDALVTGPVNKGFIEKSGCHFVGHTEYIADAICERDPKMMMFSPDYRVLLVTTHMPLSEVPAAITAERILEAIRTGWKAIRSIDEREPKVGVAGLDPHCGDNGAIGNFDSKITAEAVRLARSEGIDVEGPYAADTLFLPDRWRQFGLIIAHYHDQGLIPFKMLAFENGVNITLGLSVVRTSPDHGTAYDIAGRGVASAASALEAMKLAGLLVSRRRAS